MDTATSAMRARPADLDFQMIVENSLAGIYLVQGDRFRYVNRTLASLFGYPPEVIVREKRVEDLVAEEDRERVRESLERRMGGEVDEVQQSFRGLRSDGTLIEVEVRGRVTRVEGSPAVVGTLLDVTEREREKARLGFLVRASELLDRSLGYEETLERLAQLMRPTLADCCLIDVVEDDHLERVAVGAEETEAERGGMRVLEPDPREHPEVEVIRTGRAVLVPDVECAEGWAREMSPWRECGVRHPEVRSYMIVPLVARGQILGAMTLATMGRRRRYESGDLAFAQEVAHRAALAVDNARLYHEAQKAIKARDEVLAVVSHDLRNPLNVIVMGSAMLLEKDRRRATPLEMIHRAAEQMRRLIEDLVDVSAIDAGGLSVAPEPRAVEEVIESAVTLHAPAAEASGVELRAAVPPTLPLALIDEGRLLQALSNLIGNALKFTPAGGLVTVTAAAVEEGVRISVSDTGEGIPPAQLPHVFDRFWQAQAGDGRGVGLGLSIVQGIARAHGGEVQVESDPGRGTTFHLTLPRAEAPPVAAA